jgi:hypothetical protein
VSILGGVIFLAPAVKQVSNGVPLNWSPALATAIGCFVAYHPVVNSHVNGRQIR